MIFFEQTIVLGRLFECGWVRAHAQGVTVVRDAGVTVFSVTQEKFVTFRRDGNE